MSTYLSKSISRSISICLYVCIYACIYECLRIHIVSHKLREQVLIHNYRHYVCLIHLPYAVYIWLILFFFAKLSGAFARYCEGVSLGRHRRRMLAELAGAASACMRRHLRILSRRMLMNEAGTGAAC